MTTSLHIALVSVLGGVAVGSFATTHGCTSPAKAPPASSTPAVGPSVRVWDGPWGRLEVSSFYLELPRHYAEASNCPTGTSRWTLPGYTMDQWRDLLATARVTDAQLAQITAATVCAPQGCVAGPGRDVVLGLSHESRGVIYNTLRRWDENPLQMHAFRRRVSDPWWSVRGGFAHQARFESLTYFDGNFVLFADLNALCPSLDDPDRLRLLEMVARTSAVMAWLVVSPETDVEPLVRYWNGAGSFRDVRGVFEALARTSPVHLDVANLLPPFARARLNTFRRPNHPARDCYWSALNFFSDDTPPDVFVSGAEIEQAMAADYARVPYEQRQFGDVILLAPPGGLPVHAANYIAAGIVFSKNGAHFRRPWVLERLSEVRGTYPEATELRVYRLRRRAASPPA